MLQKSSVVIKPAKLMLNFSSMRTNYSIYLLRMNKRFSCSMLYCYLECTIKTKKQYANLNISWDYTVLKRFSTAVRVKISHASRAPLHCRGRAAVGVRVALPFISWFEPRVVR